MLAQWPPSAGSRAEQVFAVRSVEAQDADSMMREVEVLMNNECTRCYAVSIRGEPEALPSNTLPPNTLQIA